MVIIPAVDIKNGKCVRLTQGKADTAIVYQDSPVKAAMHWQENGAKYLHIVDLDGAFTGNTINFEIIKNIFSAISIPAQIGGGIRTLKDIEKYIELGTDRVILGTQAIKEPDFLKKAYNAFGNKIAVAIDASYGKIVIEGWVETTNISALDLADKVQTIGIKTVIYTDTTTDGTLKGPNFMGIEDFINKTNLNIIVSGGISTINDINKIKKLEQKGVTGIIIGKALYTKKLKSEELWNG